MEPQSHALFSFLMTVLEVKKGLTGTYLILF